MNIWLLWAKTSRGEPKVTHPLLCHMIDVAEVTRALWDGALTEGMRTWIAERMRLAPDQARQTIAFWAGLHDLGKASPAFQRQHKPAIETLEGLGLSFPRLFVQEPTRHGTISASVLQPLLESEVALPSRVARQVARAVGGHHGTWPTPKEILDLKQDQLGGANWDAFRHELVSSLAQLMRPIVVRHLGGNQEQEENAFLALLSGLVATADWIGSMEEFFPFAPEAIDPVQYSHRAATQARQALQELNWLGWQPPTRAASFVELFRFAPRPMQQAVVQLASQLAEPALVIIEAPTGTGKTEAALYLADCWAHLCQQRGLYVAMPTMATSNQMHSRVKEILGRRYPETNVEVLLVHSQARWVDDHQAHHLQTSGDSAGDRVRDMTWFLARKRALLAPMGVGTVDQALLSVLQTRHFFVRLFGLSHKSVIFDEVHAYDTYMSAVFQRLLGWLRAMNTSVVLLSATLPSSTRRELLQAYTGASEVEMPEVPYPAITWATVAEIGVVPLPPSESRTLGVEWIERDPEALAERVGGELREGGCAAIICNTVRRAQEVYQALKLSAVPREGELILFHAHFPLAWRDEIERAVLTRFGKGAGRPQKAVVVATQVIEQSLDLDFDLMVTDLAPVDLLIQRAGRLHRHDRAVRPRPLARPRVLICEPGEGAQGPDFGVDTFIYERYVLLRSWLTLYGRTQLTLPEETAALVEAVYGEEPLEARGLEQALAEAREKMEKHQDKHVFLAKQKLIPPLQAEDLLGFQSASLQEDQPETHEAFQALTRLGPPSVSLVCLHQTKDGLRLEPDGRGPEISLDEFPTPELTKQLALRTVGVSHHDVWRHLINQEVPRGWCDHSLLRDHRVAIFENGVCALAGTPYRLRLDRELGLEIRKEES